jgi:simple sugar transport system permease protein
MAGAFAIAIVGVSAGSLSPIVMIPLCIFGGIAGGALWALVPGILKARFGSHEVINTIMMNYIAAALVGFLVNSVFSVPATVHTPAVAEGAQLPRFDILFGAFQGSPANASFLLAVLSSVLVWLFFARTQWGYELRAVGLNPVAAACAHIDVPSRYAIALVLSGACAGLGGSNFVMGYKHYYEIGFSDNAGFIGIAVALLSNNNPIGVIFASLFFALLEYGGLTINFLVPKELVTILQAIVILLVVVLSKVFNDRFATARGHLFAGAAGD